MATNSEIQILLSARDAASAAVGTFNEALKTVRGTADNVTEGAHSMRDGLKEAFENPLGAVRNLGSEIASALGPIGAIAGVATVAIGGVTAAVVEIGEHGAEVHDVSQGFTNFSGTVQHADEILGALRNGVKGTISDFDLQRDALHLMSAGVKLATDDYHTLTAASLVLAHEGFGTTKEILDQLTQGLITGKTKVVERMTGVVDSKTAENNYADAMGVSTNELTKAGQAEAKRIEIMARLRQVVEDAGDQELSFKDRIDQMHVSMTNASDALGVAVATSPVLSEVLKTVGGSLQNAFGKNQVSTVQTLVGYINTGAIALVGFAETGLTGAHVVNDAFYGTREIFANVEGAIVGVAQDFVKLIEVAGDVGSKIPVIGTTFKGAADSARDWGTWLGGVRDGLKAEGEQAIDTAGTHDVAIGKMQGSLEGLRQRMIEASQTSVSATTVVNALGAAHGSGAILTDKLTEAQKRSAAAWVELNSIGESYADTVSQINPKLVDEISYYIKAGEKVGTLAAAYNDVLTPAQVDAIDQMVKANDKYAASWEKTQDAINKVWDDAAAVESENALKGIDLELAKLKKQQQDAEDAATTRILDETQLQETLWGIQDEYDNRRHVAITRNEQKLADDREQIETELYDVVGKNSMSAADYEIAQIKRWYDDKVTKNSDAHKDDQKYWDDLATLVDHKMDDVYHKHDKVFQDIKTLRATAAQQWIDHFADIVTHGGSLVDGLKGVGSLILKDFQKLLDDMLSAFITKLIKGMLNSWTGAAGDMIGSWEKSFAQPVIASAATSGTTAGTTMGTTAAAGLASTSGEAAAAGTTTGTAAGTSAGASMVAAAAVYGSVAAIAFYIAFVGVEDPRVNTQAWWNALHPGNGPGYGPGPYDPKLGPPLAPPYNPGTPTPKDPNDPNAPPPPSTFAQGGVVYAAIGFPGAPSGTDTIPAWLTPGEGVLTAATTHRIGGPAAIDHLNRGGGIGDPASHARLDALHDAITGLRADIKAQADHHQRALETLPLMMRHAMRGL